MIMPLILYRTFVLLINSDLKVAGSNPVERTTKTPRNLARFRGVFALQGGAEKCMRTADPVVFR